MMSPVPRAVLRPLSSVLCFLSSFLCFTAGCSRRETTVAAGLRTQTLHVNNLAEPRDFDPQTANAQPDISIIRALMEGLTEVDPRNCQPIPGVAERWEASADGLTWTFHLRANARWSNGDPVTARDFTYAWQRILSPALGAEYSAQFFCLENAEAFFSGKITDFAQVGARPIDDHTLVLRLKNPVPYLPSLVTHVAWFPLHRNTIEKFGRMDQRATARTRPGNLVGNGAFVLEEWTPGRVVRVVRSSTYWDRQHVRLREAVFYPIVSIATGESMFRAGQLHVSYTPVDKILTYKSDPRTAALLHDGPLLNTAFFRLNCAHPPLNDVRVRRALSFAIDREQLVRRVIHSEQPAFTLTPPGCAGYTAEPVSRLDLAEARRLLAAAGFPGGRGFPRLDVLFYGRGDAETVCEAMQQMWRVNLGVQVTLVRQEMNVVLAARRAHDYQILSVVWGGDFLDPTTFLDLLRTNDGNNHTGWSHPEYDRLLAEAGRTLEQSQRYELLRRAEALMLGEAPIIPLYYVPIRELRHPAVKGWHVNLLDLHPLKFVYLEK